MKNYLLGLVAPGKFKGYYAVDIARIKKEYQDV